MRINSPIQDENKPVALSAEDLVALDEGLRSEREDRIYTFDEVEEIRRQRRQQWKAQAAA